MVIRGIGDCVHLITLKLKKELNISFFLISTGIPFRGLKVNNIIRVYAPSLVRILDTQDDVPSLCILYGASSVYFVRIPPINKFSPLTFLYTRLH